MGRKTKLNDDLQRTVVESIQSGAYDWIAAAAAGITRQTFYNWMREGEASSRSRYHQFFVDVSQAKAEARAKAEQAVYQTAPLAWLRFGPGRERPGQPGWTESRQVSGPEGEPVQVKLDDSESHLGDVIRILKDLDLPALDRDQEGG